MKRDLSTKAVLLAITLTVSCGRNDTGNAEIHDAAGNGDLEKVRALLASNPDLVFSKDRRVRSLDGVRLQSPGATPLHVAAGGGHRNVVEFLLAHSADVNAKDDQGWTPLYLAAWSSAVQPLGHKRSMDVVELLVAHGANVSVLNRKDSDGQAILHFAALTGDADMTKWLLEHGANVNATSDFAVGATPLHVAADGGYRVVVEVLLEHGADVNAKDRNGDTPLHWATKGSDAPSAVQSRRKDVADLLRQHGGHE